MDSQENRKIGEMDQAYFKKIKTEKIVLFFLLSVLFLPFFLAFCEGLVIETIKFFNKEKSFASACVSFLLVSPFFVILPYYILTYPFFKLRYYIKLKCPDFLISDGWLINPIYQNKFEIKHIRLVEFVAEDIVFTVNRPIDTSDFKLRIDSKFLLSLDEFKNDEILSWIEGQEVIRKKKIEEYVKPIISRPLPLPQSSYKTSHSSSSLLDLIGGLIKFVFFIGMLILPVYVAGAIGTVVFGSALLGILGWLFLL